MSTGVKNGKHHTNNMSLQKILLLISLLIVHAHKSPASGSVKNWVIVIDAGHGGKDPGALGSFSAEKDLTLAIALKTGSLIEKNLENVTVLYTRKTDTFIELKDRPDIANKNNADLFISIHANSTKSRTINGTETFVMGPAKDQQNLEVAMKENEVILLENDYSTTYEGFDPKSPESYIMFTLMQNIFLKQSTSLASAIQRQYKEKNKRTDRGVKQAGFWVLFMTTMPSVLTETGFITHPEEEKYLNSKEGQDKIATSIFKACSDYITDIENKSSIFPVKVKIQNQEPEGENIVQPISSQGEIVFMVQIATSSARIETSPENFRGLNNVIELRGQGQAKYAAGNFNDYTSAVSYRKEIEEIFPDAFVIAIKDNKILPLQQAIDEKNEITKHDNK
jgi:N-acetylmuramoyl-L-alanine amidase